MIENIHLRERNHNFLGTSHAANERRSWAVIGLCTAMMALEIGGGLAFGSIALVADGLHMSTHAGALLLAALAYSYARRHVGDDRFAFSTGKLGDLAGYTSAIILSMIALVILIDAVSRLVQPVPIRFGEAIGLALLGLVVNVASLWLLGGHHLHAGHAHHHNDHEHDHDHDHDHDHETGSDNNMRAAIVHVLADAAVSVLVIAGLITARFAGWLWIDPAVGIIGALVIASWALTLIRDTGGILLDMTPDRTLAAELRGIVADEGDEVIDFHLWRLGPGHLGAIVSIAAKGPRDAAFYREKLGELPQLSHITVEIIPV